MVTEEGGPRRGRDMQEGEAGAARLRMGPRGTGLTQGQPSQEKVQEARSSGSCAGRGWGCTELWSLAKTSSLLAESNHTLPRPPDGPPLLSDSLSRGGSQSAVCCQGVLSVLISALIFGQQAGKEKKGLGGFSLTLPPLCWWASIRVSHPSHFICKMGDNACPTCALASCEDQRG